MRKIHSARRTADGAAAQPLLDELSAARAALRAAYFRFDNASEPELIDACIYEINAAQARCGYLIRLAKERGLSASIAASAGTEGAACL